MKVMIACGGTGGHLFPGLAVAEELQKRGDEVLLLISEKEIDSLALREHSNFNYQKIASVGLPKLLSPAVFSFGFRFLNSLIQCRRIVRNFKPDAVLGMGGFTSTAPILAGRLSGVPTFIHESNAIAGKANKLNAKLSGMVLLGVRECGRYFDASKIKVTGTPVRTSLRSPVDKEAVLKAYGFSADKPVLLIMGGSQGAHGLNEAVIKALPKLKKIQPQIIHLAGGYDESMVAEAYRSEGISARISAFHHHMEELYSIANLVVSRSGAASLSELAWFGLPAVLLPYPYAAEDHQTHNAMIAVNAGSAKLLPESSALQGTLADLLLELIEDSSQLNTMAGAARKSACRNAEQEVVNCIEKFCKK